MTNGFSDPQQFDAFFAAAYEDLRHLAALVKRRHKSATLNPKALVHEVGLKISGRRRLSAVSELHFKRIAARAMRQVQIDDARRRKASQRGGPNGVLVTMDFSQEPMMVAEDELIAVDSSLDKLALMSPRQAAVVENRFLGGLEMTEIAELLRISEATVLRDWRAAQAWLAQEVRKI